MIGDDGEIGEMAFGAGWGEEDAGAEEVAEWVVEVREKRNSHQVSPREAEN